MDLSSVVGLQMVRQCLNSAELARPETILSAVGYSKHVTCFGGATSSHCKTSNTSRSPPGSPEASAMIVRLPFHSLYRYYARCMRIDFR